MARLGGEEFFGNSAGGLDIEDRVTLLEYKLDLLVRAMLTVEDAVNAGSKLREINKLAIHRLGGKVQMLRDEVGFIDARIVEAEVITATGQDVAWYQMQAEADEDLDEE